MEHLNPPPPLQRSVSAAFRRARKAAGLDQDDWAQQLGSLVGREIDGVYIEDIEGGRLVPLADLLLAAADASQTPLSALVKDRSYHQLVKDVQALQRERAVQRQAAG